jgi:predicted acetyltransferase
LCLHGGVASGKPVDEMNVEVVKAGPGDRLRLENLMELYLHDFSEILHYAPHDDGRFGYDRLDVYWSEAGRYPFLIWADRRLAGFALVARGSVVSGDPSVFDMAEFFVVRGLRRHGVGATAAAHVFSSLAGTWEVRVLELNAAAQLFWDRAVSSFTDGAFEVGTWCSDAARDFRVFRFISCGR